MWPRSESSCHIFSITLWTQAAEYNVSVYTGTKFGAGTDARVFITLYGEKGDSGEVELQGRGGQEFENGK